MSIDGGMDKENVALYIQWNIIQPLKKEILPFATTWMDLEGIMLSEISQRKTNTIWFTNYTSGYVSGKNKKTNSKRYMHPKVQCSIIYYRRETEATEVCFNRWMNEEDVAYMCSGYYSVIKICHLQHHRWTWSILC